MSIEKEYRRLADGTGLECFSITFWRTMTGNWGARAGLGESAFAISLETAVRNAVDDGIAAFARRAAEKPKRRKLA